MSTEFDDHIFKQAFELKTWDRSTDDKHLVQKLYRMDPPHEGSEYVLASATRGNSNPIRLFFDGLTELHETFLFAADEEGEVQDWAELNGSIRLTTNHAEALAEAGYVEIPLTEGEAA